MSPEDAQKALRCLKEAPLKDEQIFNLQAQIETLEKGGSLSDAEVRELTKLKELAEKEAQLYKEAYEREKGFYERAMKLADEKAKTDWGKLGLIGGFGILIGMIFGLLL